MDIGGQSATEVDPREIQGEDRMEDRPQFRVDLLKPSESVAVVDVEGEVDIYSAPQFKEVLLQGIEEGASRIIVDLAKVTFIDSTALGVLVSGAKRVRPQNGTLDIVCADDNITRIFEITGLDRIFGIYPTREDALSVAAG
jgi:anti-sigma B factor antagonist